MRHDFIAARKADVRGFRDLVARRQKRVDACEQPLPLRAARRVAEALGREEGRNRERPRVPEGEVREARQSRLEAVHDVEPAARECEREARAHADRNSHPASSRDRDGRADGDQLRRLVEGAEQRTPPGGEVAGAVRGSQDGDGMAAVPQLARQPVHVLVHVVRLRPGERRDERDPHGDRV